MISQSSNFPLLKFLTSDWKHPICGTLADSPVSQIKALHVVVGQETLRKSRKEGKEGDSGPRQVSSVSGIWQSQ